LEAAGVSFLPGGAVIGPAPAPHRAARPEGAPIRWVDATDLSQWADRRVAQGSIPELLTRLIRAATGLAPKVIFPADESIQFAGWDGTCEVAVGTEHVPEGSSGWEIGTQRAKIIEKAEAVPKTLRRAAGPCDPRLDVRFRYAPAVAAEASVGSDE